MLSCNLRPKKDHSMNGAVDFIKQCLKITDELGITKKILFRLDSGYDSADLIEAVNDKCYYIIKRNIRQESKEYWLDHAKSHCDDMVQFEEVKVLRRRIRTVLLKIIYSACKYVFSENYYMLRFGIDNKYYIPVKILNARYA